MDHSHVVTLFVKVLCDVMPRITAPNNYSLLALPTHLSAGEFRGMTQTISPEGRNIFGEQLASQVKDVWGFDEEGEVRSIWRKTGHPGFWFFGGNLALCRYWSRMLALQIKALEEGICKYDDR